MTKKIKPNKLLTENTQEIWANNQTQHLRKVGIEGRENIIEKSVEENFPNLRKDIPVKLQEA